MAAEVNPCPECGSMTILALAEPDARPVVFDAQASKGWRIVEVTPSYCAAIEQLVHAPHSLSCKPAKRT